MQDTFEFKLKLKSVKTHQSVTYHVTGDVVWGFTRKGSEDPLLANLQVNAAAAAAAKVSQK